MTDVLAPPHAVRDRPPPVQVQGGTALTLIAVGAAAVIALWWHDTAFVYGLDGWLTNAGRVTGLLAGYAVVVLLALMARMPALEHGVGTDRLARWHAMGGRYTVSLSVAHTLLIIWGYAITAHAGLVGETDTLLTAYPDVLMATVALFLLLGIGIASARAARRRLRYETWHYIHLYTYLAIALAFSHQFATGADFRYDAAARWVWSVMYALVAARAALVPGRHAGPAGVPAPACTSWGCTASAATWSRSCSAGRHLEELRAEPGQFFRWRFLTRDLWWAGQPVLAVRPGDQRPPAHHGARSPARTARRCCGCGRAPGCSPRGPTGRSPRRAAGAGRCC